MSVGRLALQLVTTAAQIAFLQEVNILPVLGVCHGCGATIDSDFKEKKNQRVWQCGACSLTTTIRHDTVLYQSNMPYDRFIMMAYCFTQRNVSYAQVINECCLPNENYQDKSMSKATVNRWFTYFRHLCCMDWLRKLEKIGGKCCIVEIDESMHTGLRYSV